MGVPRRQATGGETLATAVERELAEELDLDVLHVAEESVAIADDGNEFLIEFIEADVEGVPRPSEHSATEWVDPTEATSYPLAPADQQFVTHHLLEER